MNSDALFDDLLNLLEQQEMENRQVSTREEQNSLIPTSSQAHVPNGASTIIRQMFTNPLRRDPTPSTSQETSSSSHNSNPSTSQTPSHLNSREHTTSRSRRTSSSRSRRTSFYPHRTVSSSSRQTPDRAPEAVGPITLGTSSSSFSSSTSSQSRDQTPSTSQVARNPAILLVPFNTFIQANVYSNLQRPAPSSPHEPSESLPQRPMAPGSIAIASGSVYINTYTILTIRTNTENNEHVFARPRPVPLQPNTQTQSRQEMVNEESANVLPSPIPPLMPPVLEERSVTDEYLDMDTTLFPELYT